MRQRAGQAGVGIGVGLLLVAAAVQGQADLAEGSTSGNALWTAVAGIAIIFVGVRLALTTEPAPADGPASIDVPAAQPPAGSVDRFNVGAAAALAAVSFGLMLIAWLAPRPEGSLAVLFVGVPAWAVFVPSMIALLGELFKRRPRDPDQG